MVNDISIATGIIGFMFLVALIIPQIQAEFFLTQTTLGTDIIEDNINPELSNEFGVSNVKQLSIVGSVATMFFWTYTFLPVSVQMFFLVIRIVLILVLAKYIPFVG